MTAPDHPDVAGTTQWLVQVVNGNPAQPSSLQVDVLLDAVRRRRRRDRLALATGGALVAIVALLVWRPAVLLGERENQSPRPNIAVANSLEKPTNTSTAQIRSHSGKAKQDRSNGHASTKSSEIASPAPETDASQHESTPPAPETDASQHESTSPVPETDASHSETTRRRRDDQKATKRDPPRHLPRPSPPDPGGLFAQAQAARAAHDLAEARRLLMLIRTHYPSSSYAGQATFILGRVARELGKNGHEASTWFERYLHDFPRGPLANQARGRLLQLALEHGDTARARELATVYLKRDPMGPYAALARRVLDDHNPR